MYLCTTIIYFLFINAAWAVDQTLSIEDSPDFVDEDGAQPAALLAGIGVTQATIITATPTNNKLANSSTTSNSVGTGSAKIVTATTVSSTKDTSSTTQAPTRATSSTTEMPTTKTATTETSTRVSLNTESSTTSSTSASTITVPTSTVSSKTSPKPSEEEIFLALLAENTVALTKSDFLGNILKFQTSNIISDLNKQVKSLARINNIEKLLLNVTRSLAVSEADLLQSLVNSIYKVDYYGNRTINTISYLLKFQELHRDRVNNFSSKLIGMQEQILRSSKGMDDKLSLVNQILKQYITPRVNNLKESLGNINASQIISEDELKNLPVVKNLTENFIIKATSLLNQLAMLNQTQDKSLYFLEEAVNEPEFVNLQNIDELLHSVIISQKRIDLAFLVCENRRSKYDANPYAPFSKNYSKEYVSTGSEAKSPLTHSKNSSCEAKTYDKLSEY